MQGNQQPAALVNPMQNQNYAFKFLSYYFDKNSLTGTFVYQGIDNIIFTEKVTFAPHPEAAQGKKFNVLDDPSLNQTLDNAMFLAFVLIGTSYYKAHPTPYVKLPKAIDAWQAKFFDKVFQEGLSQYAFENGLTRQNLAHFQPTISKVEQAARPYRGDGIISLQSGGKDSLLVATLLLEANIDFIPWYVSSDKEGKHPAVIDEIFPQLINKGANVVIRELDQVHLQETGGLNGHIPITYINEALAIIQAILDNKDTILTSIGNEGSEPHSYIGDLPVNHQWSKTWEAEQLMAEYVKRYISEDIKIGSPIRKYSELRIAELFVINLKSFAEVGHKSLTLKNICVTIQACIELFFFVIFIVNLSNYFFQNVLKSNNSACTAILIYNYRDVYFILLELTEQIVYLLRFWHKIRRTYQALPPEIVWFAKMWQ